MLYARQPACTGACEFLSFIQGEAEVARRVTFAAVAHGLDQVGPAIPLGVARSARFENACPD